MIKSKRKFVIIIIIIVSFILFSILNILWFQYKNNCFDYIVKNNTEYAIESVNIKPKVYVIRKKKSSAQLNLNADGTMNYSIRVIYPKYLNFTGGYSGSYSVSQSIYMSDDSSGKPANSYCVSFSIKPSYHGETQIKCTIYDYKDDGKIYSFFTNWDLEILKLSNSELNPENLLNNPDAKAEIDETFNIAKEYFYKINKI